MLIPQNFSVFGEFDNKTNRYGMNPFRARYAAVDVKETDKDVVVEMEAPDIDPEKTDITIEGNLMKIEVRKEDIKEETKENFFRREIYRGSFSRLVPLPARVDESKADAEYDKGVLRITVPKIDMGKKENKIKIKVK